MPSKKSWRRSSVAKGVSITSPSGPVLGGNTGRRIESAFRGEGAKWRTIGGIARETGLPEKEVRAYVGANEELFERARLSPGGRVLYSIRGLPGASTSASRKAAAG